MKIEKPLWKQESKYSLIDTLYLVSKECFFSLCSITFLNHFLQKISHFLRFIFILCIGLFCFHMCLCTMCIPEVHGVQKRESGPLELELWMIVSYHVSVRNRICVC